MPSTFTWLDYSEADRRRMLDVIDLFRRKEARDELGLGVVRDVFADLFFPGTSVVQTRARYFLFVPWMYQALERRGISARDAAKYGRGEEVRLIDILIRNSGRKGVIGQDSREKLQRLPSAIYWQGLGAWGIRRFPGTLEEYHRLFDRFSRRARSVARADDGEIYEHMGNAWHENLPAAPPGFPESAVLQLELHEAEYLAERITTSYPRSLLALMIRRSEPFGAVSGIPWDAIHEADAEQGMWLFHARLFSETMHGAALLYNLMLAELRVSDTAGGGTRIDHEELAASYRAEFEEWYRAMQEGRAALESWDRAAFWGLLAGRGARVTPSTRLFIETWIRLVLLHGAELTPLEEEGRHHIAVREGQLKGARARLNNLRARELWQGASGAGRILYRWPSAVMIADDIITALHGEAA